jgi:hypothetical protein
MEGMENLNSDVKICGIVIAVIMTSLLQPHHINARAIEKIN